jgi:outer membrane protein assembly factor BamB
MVQHLEETAGDHLDSTANDNDGTTVVVSDQDAAGKVDGCDELDGADDYVRVPNDSSLQFGEGSFTAEAWIYPHDVPESGGARIINTRGTGAAGDYKGYQLKIKDDTGRWHFGDAVIDDATGNYMAYAGTTTYSYNQWYQVVMVYEADSELRFYVNGSPDGTLTVGSYGSLSNSLPTAIGAAIAASGVEGTHNQWFDGLLDEIRLSDVARSEGWISTSYKNLSDPDTFISLGSLELESGPPEVSNPVPVDGAGSVSLSLSELSFDLHDPDGDLMDYTVTTTPDIGMDSATGVPNGSYTLTVSGLAADTTYTWEVDVTADSDNTVESFSFTTRKAAAAWWDSDWAYRKEIIVDHAQVSESQSNFPLMVSIDDGSLLDLVQEDGDDIAFTDYSGAQLDHEIEFYDPASGELVVWVNVPSLSSLEDTYLYMYFGNREAANQQNPSGVWDSDYVLVQHLDEASGVHYDSSSYGNDGTPQNLASQDAAGKIDGGVELDGTQGQVNVGTGTSLDVFGSNQDFSITLWAKREDINNVEGFYASGETAAYGIFFGSAFFTPTDLRFLSKDNTVDMETSGNVLNDTNWHYIGLTADRDGYLDFWVDGVSVYSGSIATTAAENWNRGNDTYKIGTDRSESIHLDGILDEVRVSRLVRSPGWIQTSYNNQSNPSAFYTMSQEPVSAYAAPTVSLVSPLDSATEEAPVSFSFIPQTNVPGAASRAQAELWLNVTETLLGEVVYSDDSHAPQRGVIKDGNLVMVEGRGGACYITVRAFPAGIILKQGPSFGSGTHSNTSVVIEGDVIYGLCTNGVLQAWNQATESLVWQITVGPGGSYPTTSNSMEVYDGHLYLQSADFEIHKVRMSDGVIVDSMPLDNTGGLALKAHMLVDYDNDRLYALGDSNYYAIDLTTFTQIYSPTIQTAGGTPVPNAGRDTRGGPVLINAANSGGHLTIPGAYLTIFTAFPQNGVFAYDYDGNVVWSWTGKPIRAHATYNPNTGLIYVVDATGYTDAGTGLTLPGTVYALDVNDGTEVWSSHGDGTDRFSRPITASDEYLIFKTDNPSSDDYLYVLDATSGDVLTKVPAGGNKGYWCFPPALSGGYVATGGGYTAQGGNVLDIYHIGTGDAVDYYPLHGNTQHTGYVENGLTELGFVTTTWKLAKVNDTAVVDGVENTIEYDFAAYALPMTTDWKIKLVQSDNQSAWSGERGITVNAKWYDSSWMYRKAITIDHWKVPEDLSDFPLLVSLSEDADVGDYAQLDGEDILFATPSGVKLDHEIELYDASSPADLVAWVRVPLVSSSSDTIVYMYYGNTGAAAQENPTGVWDSNYVMVQHLDEDTGPHLDSTSNDNDSTTVVVTNQDATGAFNGADEFDGADDHIRVPNHSSLGFGEGGFTAEAWIYPRTIPDTGGARIVNNRGTGGGGSYAGYQLKIANATDQWKFKDASIDDAGGTYKAYESSRTYAYNQWYHVSMVYEADDELRFYVNGARDGLVSVGAYGDISNGLPTAIGGSIAHNGIVDEDNKQFFDGIIDEVRLSNIPRSPGWISAQYNNQSNPGTFYQVGEQETETPTAVPMASFSAEAAINTIVVSWETVIENNLLGFNLYRSESFQGERTKLNLQLILPKSNGSPFGNKYSFSDTDILAGSDYFYWLEILETDKNSWYGPANATTPFPIFVPIIGG